MKNMIELTEEEREFLERTCKRALNFSTMGLNNYFVSKNEKNGKKLEILIQKLGKKNNEI